ncbi:uncharacterized protein B0T23DRAFT_440244 [Neurospora hispaniola]|uniref:Uncharacterized protein n=1 Tax=Neurospora hispaniola TaxID=588809 RepID=A0AAJ0MSH5_9PEZI|nr:hypothetical protein B0T23DRAFT_440244 [Neurospora hispaniola]
MGNDWKIKIGKPSWGAKGQSSSRGRGLAIHSLRKGDDLLIMTRMTPLEHSMTSQPWEMIFVVLSNMNCRQVATGIQLTSSLPRYDVWQPDKQDLKAVCSLSTRARLSVNQGRNHLTESRGYQCQSQPATMLPSEDIQKEAWMVQGHDEDTTRETRAPWQETLEWQTYTWISRCCTKLTETLIDTQIKYQKALPVMLIRGRQSHFHSRSVFPARDQVNDHQIRQHPFLSTESPSVSLPGHVSSNYADQFGKPFSASGFPVSILITRKLVMTLDRQYKGFPVLVPPFEVEGPGYRRWWHP